MLEVYTRSYYGKIRTDVIYYFYINVRGKRKFYQTIYESTSDIGYQYSRYEITLNGEIRNSERIENFVYRYTPVLFSRLKAQRRLAVLSKFVLYITSEVNNVPIYKLVKQVTYYHNGIELTLSPNAFAKSTYALIPRFEKVYRPE